MTNVILFSIIILADVIYNGVILKVNIQNIFTYNITQYHSIVLLLI